MLVCLSIHNHAGVAGGFVLVIMSCVILILSTIKVRYFKPKMKREGMITHLFESFNILCIKFFYRCGI